MVSTREKWCMKLMQHLEPKGLVCGEEEREVLQMHVGASGAVLAVTTLETDDLLSDTCGDGRGRPAFACKDARDVHWVVPTEGRHSADSVPHHWTSMGEEDAW
jgi:hypothetical protein